MVTGKTLSLHAGAHPPRPSESLYSEASRDRRELPADGQYPPGSTRTSQPTSKQLSAVQEAAWWVIQFDAGRTGLRIAASDQDADRDVYGADANSPATRTLDEAHPAATAAVALTQLHHHRMNSEWESEMVRTSPNTSRARLADKATIVGLRIAFRQ